MLQMIQGLSMGPALSGALRNCNVCFVMCVLCVYYIMFYMKGCRWPLDKTWRVGDKQEQTGTPPCSWASVIYSERRRLFPGTQKAIGRAVSILLYSHSI